MNSVCGVRTGGPYEAVIVVVLGVVLMGWILEFFDNC